MRVNKLLKYNYDILYNYLFKMLEEISAEEKKSEKNKICGNCGLKGHIYKNCKQPITSLGIITFKVINNDIKYLLIRRKDTIGYVEFLRGKYNLYEKEYIKKLFEEMTFEEVERIINNEFDYLWINLWIDKNRNFKKEYEKAKDKFMKVKNNQKFNLVEIIKEIGEFWKEPEWGFPKGRRNIRESDIDCAIREFKEETGYEKKDIKILKYIQPVKEQFLGSNNIEYKHIYYLANFKNNKKPGFHNKHQFYEISKIDWFSYEEAKKIIRPYHKQKINILKNIDNLLQNNFLNYI